MHHGVRGWPLKVLIHFKVLQSTIRTVWSPWDDAILVLELKNRVIVSLNTFKEAYSEAQNPTTCNLQSMLRGL